MEKSNASLPESSIAAIELLSCPVCHEHMQGNGGQLYCTTGHSFDRAKENYVNLLLANMKGSKAPGDSKAAVLARHQFLNKEHYAPIAKLIHKQIINHVNAEKITLIDSGCGEGYYLEQLHKQNSQRLCLGFDISKAALRAAGKNRKGCHWFVASAKTLPIQPQSIDVLLNCFSPFFDENISLVKPGGILIFINGEKTHLEEMRTVIYKENFTHQFQPRELGAAVTLLNKERLQYSIHLETEDELQNLIKMTPHHYKAPLDAQHKFIKSAPRNISVDVVAYVYSVNSG